MYGGAGADIFDYVFRKDIEKSKAEADTIFNFNQREGDKMGMVSAFSFYGTGKLSGKEGEQRYEKGAFGTYIYGDRDGDGKADTAIHLDDALSLSRDDFLFY